MDQAGIEELNYDFSIKEDLSKSGTAWLNIKSELANDPRVTVEVYPTISDGTYIYVLKNPITNEILNQDMEKTGKGFQISGEHNDGEKFFIRVFVDGKQYDQKFIVMRNWNWYPYYEGKMYVIQDEKKQNAVSHIENTFDSPKGITTLSFELGEEYSARDQYYFDLDYVMKKNWGTTESNNYDVCISKVVLGHYDSIEEAEKVGAKDVTKEIVSNGNGYLDSYGGDGVKFTVFKHAKLSDTYFSYDTLADKIIVRTIDSAKKMREYTDDPIIGEADPWFRIVGATDADGEKLDTYTIENGKKVNIDTMYGYGYQTVFINEDVDSFIPMFEKADDEAVYVDTIYVNNEKYSAGDAIAFPNGGNVLNAKFSVIIIDSKGRHTKNYNVSFVKKGVGAQLYVAGPLAPDIRSVFLDEYHENKHDIFLANVGDEPLTDLWLDLDATNVKLDEYWTIGGTGNNNLSACPDNFAKELAATSYGELPNVAKSDLFLRLRERAAK